MAFIAVVWLAPTPTTEGSIIVGLIAQDRVVFAADSRQDLRGTVTDDACKIIATDDEVFAAGGSFGADLLLAMLSRARTLIASRGTTEEHRERLLMKMTDFPIRREYPVNGRLVFVTRRPAGPQGAYADLDWTSERKKTLRAYGTWRNSVTAGVVVMGNEIEVLAASLKRETKATMSIDELIALAVRGVRSKSNDPTVGGDIDVLVMTAGGTYWHAVKPRCQGAVEKR